MPEEEVPLLIVGPWVMASKRKSHRAQVRAIVKSLSKFLQDNGLATREFLPEGAEIPEDFVINESDLTAEGYALYTAAVEKKWFAAIDRGVDPSNTEILRKALVAIRSSQKADKKLG